MRKRLLFCMLVAALVALFVAVVTVSNDRRDRDVLGYNVLAERVIEGSVDGQSYTIDQILYFPLRTATSVVQVQIGPKAFVKRSHFEIQTGDMVTVTGMPVVMNGQDVVLAREVRGMHGVLIVRDSRGLPLWENDRPIRVSDLQQIDGIAKELGLTLGSRDSQNRRICILSSDSSAFEEG